jgi:hypothetical protein
MRVKEKLGDEHVLVQAIQSLYDDTGFRNLCSHWKNPDIQITKEEMSFVVEKWKAVENLARCQSSECFEWLKFDSSSSSFSCPCGKTSLSKTKIEKNK